MVGEILKKTLKKEADLVREFATEPKGPFQLIDRSIENVREGARDIRGRIARRGVYSKGALEKTFNRKIFRSK